MKSKTNILYIFHVSFIGGGSLCLLNIIKKLDRELFNPIVLLKDDGPLCSELEKIGATVIIESSINPVPYNSSLLKICSIRQIASVLWSMKKINYWIEKTDADIVHINTMMMYPYAIPAKKAKKKVIIHMREHWPKNQNQIQFNFAKKIIDKYSDKIIAINKTSSAILGLPNKTEIIYDWIDFENRNEYVDFNLLFGANFKSLKIFLFLGGMQIIKGAHEVVQVFSENISDKNARLLFVGCEGKSYENSSSFKGKIKTILRCIKLSVFSDKIKRMAQKDDRIVFIPTTNQVKSLIEQSNYLISFPTIPHAILPIAEAVYLGKPVISAKTPEAREYSNDGKSAVLFEMNNKEDFQEAIRYAIENESKLIELANTGSKIIQSTFDPIKNSLLLNNLYRKLLN